MTTERPSRPGPRPGPTITLTTPEWRLLLTAGLAATYALEWVAFAITLPGRESTLPGMDRPPERAAAVWLDELPPAERPTVTLPSGWALAARDVVPTTVRVPTAGRPRVRTRSS